MPSAADVSVSGLRGPIVPLVRAVARHMLSAALACTHRLRVGQAEGRGAVSERRPYVLLEWAS